MKNQRITKIKTDKKTQGGQALLIVIMLLATIITVITTVSFKSNTETQITKLEEESQKTLAAAEAGIEKAIGDRIASGGNYLYSNLQLSNLSGIDLNSSSVTVSTNTGTNFVSPLVQKDQQYTFYMSGYVDNVFSSPYAGNITTYYGSESNCSAIALEITVISGNGPYTINKYISDSGGILTSPAGTGVNNIRNGAGAVIGGTNFNCKTNAIAMPANVKILLVRILGNRSKIAILGSSPLRPQGKFITSEAVSQTGVTKKIQLFQSLPQIPAEFFVTAM